MASLSMRQVSEAGRLAEVENARRQNHHKLREQNNRHTFQETA